MGSTKLVAYSPDSASSTPQWCWDCDVCYDSQSGIADEYTAERLANTHAALHGIRAFKA